MAWSEVLRNYRKIKNLLEYEIEMQKNEAQMEKEEKAVLKKFYMKPEDIDKMQQEEK